MAGEYNVSLHASCKKTRAPREELLAIVGVDAPTLKTGWNNPILNETNRQIAPGSFKRVLTSKSNEDGQVFCSLMERLGGSAGVDLPRLVGKETVESLLVHVRQLNHSSNDTISALGNKAPHTSADHI